MNGAVLKIIFCVQVNMTLVVNWHKWSHLQWNKDIKPSTIKTTFCLRLHVCNRVLQVKWFLLRKKAQYLVNKQFFILFYFIFLDTFFFFLSGNYLGEHWMALLLFRNSACLCSSSMSAGDRDTHTLLCSKTRTSAYIRTQDFFFFLLVSLSLSFKTVIWIGAVNKNMMYFCLLIKLSRRPE